MKSLVAAMGVTLPILVMAQQSQSQTANIPPLSTGAGDIQGREQREARNKMFNFSGKELPLNLRANQQFRHLAFAALRPLPELPIAESDTIVFGEMTRAQVFLSNNRRALYTEYTFKVEGVCKTPKSIAPGAELAIGRLGGAARLESGGVLRYDVKGFGPEPLVGSRYLMFLQYVPPPADAYALIKFWNIEDGVITAAFDDDVARVEKAQSVMNRSALAQVISRCRGSQ